MKVGLPYFTKAFSSKTLCLPTVKPHEQKRTLLMVCRGVHFAITPDVMEILLKASNDQALIEIIQETIEEKWEKEWLCQTDKAWDAIHRCLTDGRLEYDNGTFPLNHCILGGENLHHGDNYIISLVRPEKVGAVAEALQSITEQDMRTRYFQLDPIDYDGEIGEDDFDYSWNWFTGLPKLFHKASQKGRAVIFTVDQ